MKPIPSLSPRAHNTHFNDEYPPASRRPSHQSSPTGSTTSNPSIETSPKLPKITSPPSQSGYSYNPQHSYNLYERVSQNRDTFGFGSQTKRFSIEAKEMPCVGQYDIHHYDLSANSTKKVNKQAFNATAKRNPFYEDFPEYKNGLQFPPIGAYSNHSFMAEPWPDIFQQDKYNIISPRAKQKQAPKSKLIQISMGPSNHMEITPRRMAAHPPSEKKSKKDEFAARSNSRRFLAIYDEIAK